MRSKLCYLQKTIRNNHKVSTARTILNEFERQNVLPSNHLNLNSQLNVKEKLESLGMVYTQKIDAYEPKYLTQSASYALKAVMNDFMNILTVMCNYDN